MKKKILLTGALGYIGSHAVVFFEEAGYEVVIVDNLVNSSTKALDGIEKIIGRRPQFYDIDLRDEAQLDSIFQKHDFEGVIHFAGLKAVGESCEKTLEYFDNNIVGSLRLFTCMERHGVKNLIFSSSATVYDPKNFESGVGVTELGTTGETTNPYGTTKFLIERILRDLSEFSNFKVMNLRYFNPVGAHPSGLIGEYPDLYPNNLLPYIMKVVCGELEKLSIFGGDYNTVDGTGVRDFIDVCDLVEAHIYAFKKLEGIKEKHYNNYNLGTGRGTSVLELLKITEKISGKAIGYEIAPRRPGDIAQAFCNPEKASRELGWTSKTSIDKSVANSYLFSKNISGVKK